MGNNNRLSPQDEEYENTQRSMSGRVDEEEEMTMTINGEEVTITPDKGEPERRVVQTKDDEEDKDDEEEQVDPELDKSKEDEDQDEDLEEEPVERKPDSKVHIPVKKYTEEKKAWKQEKLTLQEERDRLAQELETKEKKISELSTLVDASNKEVSEKKLAEKISAYAEKHNMTEEEVKDLVDIIADPSLKETATQKVELPAEAQELLREFQLSKIKTAYDEEFKSEALPALTKLFPNATDEQIAKIKATLDVESHKPENANKELSYILFKNQDSYAKLVEEKPVVQKKNMAGFEKPRRMAGDKTEGYTAIDFKKGTVDFAVLNDLPDEQSNKIIADFDTDTYHRYLSYRREDEGITVTRGGKKVVLK